MKYPVLLFACLLMLVCEASAQKKELKLFKKSNGIGGFGGFSFNINTLGNSNLTGEGAAGFGNFYFGGYGFSSDLGKYHSTTNNYNYHLRSGEGGLMIGAVSNTDQFFSIFTEVKFGWGSILASRQIGPNIYEEFEGKLQSITPKIGFGIMPISFVQLRIYASYYHAVTREIGVVNTDFITDYNFGIGLYFGSF